MASAEAEVVPTPVLADGDQPTLPTRSWRKKYKKLRQSFARVMNDSNVLTKEDDRAHALARRLQEENEQLLEILHEMHTGSNMQPSRRVDFASIDRTSASPSLTNASTAESDTHDESLLSDLLSMAHRKYDIHDIPDELLQESASNYLDVSYLQEYTQNLDEQLKTRDGEDAYEVLKDPNRVTKPTPNRTPATEKELILQNSDSVICWLRRHQPESFVQDKDKDKDKDKAHDKDKDKEHKDKKDDEKGSKHDGTSSKKRSSTKRASAAAPPPKKEVEDFDEEHGMLLDPPAPEKPSKAKRSKDDEPYRPKGGSSKGAKRKRTEDGDGKALARGKRAKA